ncbi:hypothetical protein [Sandaracinus amylolyticus]|uniref:hypothetical protein n=1 Tax=Sandaracinus amylolyticus TaxID=927083 RepID=UPI001F266944|nr:hypothetical protein [Sandaracinus amylolyticus]UJR80834.1 Hypothetical protein I5071_28840 [Sandaracinus amylolyticus]
MKERAREIPALLFALAWLVGFEVGPALHLARHASLGAHEHGAGAATHCHDGVCHDDEGSERDERPAPDHGAGSLEHGGLAALAPAPVLAALIGPCIAEIVTPAREVERVSAPRVERPRARAPPASTIG